MYIVRSVSKIKQINKNKGVTIKEDAQVTIDFHMYTQRHTHTYIYTYTITHKMYA